MPGWGASAGASPSSLPQDPEQAAHLGQRLAPGLLDGEQRLARALGILLEEQRAPRRPGRS